jgi:hypothetical protein
LKEISTLTFDEVPEVPTRFPSEMIVLEVDVPTSPVEEEVTLFVVNPEIFEGLQLNKLYLTLEAVPPEAFGFAMAGTEVTKQLEREPTFGILLPYKYARAWF